jgi:hypothetical protein
MSKSNNVTDTGGSHFAKPTSVIDEAGCLDKIKSKGSEENHDFKRPYFYKKKEPIKNYTCVKCMS